MAIKLDLNLPIYDLSGEVIKEANNEDAILGIKLAEFLTFSTEWDAEKLLRIARLLYQKQPVEIELVDTEALITLIQRDQHLMRVLVKGQIIEAIRKQMAEQQVAK